MDYFVLCNEYISTVGGRVDERRKPGAPERLADWSSTSKFVEAVTAYYDRVRCNFTAAASVHSCSCSCVRLRSLL